MQLNRGTADNTVIPTDGVAGNTDIVIGGGTLQIAASEQIGNTAGIALDTGTFNYSGSGLTETIGSLANNGGTLTTGANTLIVSGGTLGWNAGTNTVSAGGLLTTQHLSIVGGTNTVAGGATGGVLQIDGGGAGLELTGSALTLNSNAASGGKLLLKGGLHTLASATDSTITSGFALAVPGAIDLDGGTRTFNIEDGAASTDLAISAAINNGDLVKTGAGTLTLTGPQSYTSLLVNDGVTNLDAAATNATVTASGGALNVHVSQTLTALSIGAGAVVTLSELPPTPIAPIFTVETAAAAIPEPGSMSLLVIGALACVRLRQGRAAQKLTA